MTSGHRPTLKPGRVPSPPGAPPAGPAGSSPTLAAAIVAAADALTTQVRRIAVALERPVVEHIDADQTTGDDALRDRIAEALEAADYRPDMRRGDLADSVLPVIAPLLVEVDTLRGWLDGDSLQVIDEMVSYHAQLSEQRQAAEQQRDQLAATLRDVLGHFVHKGHPGEPCLQTGWIAEKTVAKWRAVLDPPATEERPDFADTYADPNIIGMGE